MKLTKDLLKKLIVEELEEAYRTRKRGYDWQGLPYHAGAAYDAAVEKNPKRYRSKYNLEDLMKKLENPTARTNLAKKLISGINSTKVMTADDFNLNLKTAVGVYTNTLGIPESDAEKIFSTILQTDPKFIGTVGKYEQNLYNQEQKNMFKRNRQALISYLTSLKNNPTLITGPDIEASKGADDFEPEAGTVHENKKLKIKISK